MIRRKICNRSGFSLAEMMLAVLILLLVSLIVANGVPAATRAYEKVVIGANAKTMLSTAITALRDELATAKDVTVGTDGTTITYYSADIGATSQIFLDVAPEGKDPVEPAVMLQEYTDSNPSIFTEDEPMQSAALRPLVSGIGTTEGGLYVTYTSAALTDNGESITITGLSVKRSTSDALATANLTIRLLIPAPESA